MVVLKEGDGRFLFSRQGFTQSGTSDRIGLARSQNVTIHWDGEYLTLMPLFHPGDNQAFHAIIQARRDPGKPGATSLCARIDRTTPSRWGAPEAGLLCSKNRPFVALYPPILPAFQNRPGEPRQSANAWHPGCWYRFLLPVQCGPSTMPRVEKQ